MLIGNYSVVNKHPGRTFTSPTVYNNAEIKTGSRRSMFSGATGGSNYMNRSSGTPTGYRAPYSWNMAQVSGGLGSFTLVSGVGSASANLAGGLNAEAGLTGGGFISIANLSLVLSAVALIQGSGTFSASISGKLEASITLAGSGNFVASITALGNAIALMSGTGSMSNSITATADITATLTPFTDLSPENLARAVWEALAADFNTAGTMGNKLNSAGSAGDPWSTILPGSYTGDQAGAIVDRLESLITQVKALTAAQS